MIKQRLFLFQLILFNLIVRYWKIGIIPPLLNNTQLYYRLLPALVSAISPVFIYIYLVKTVKNVKLSLITAFFLSILPLSFIEGRIASFVSVYMFILLIFLILRPKLFILIFPLFLFTFPVSLLNLYSLKFVNNFLVLASFDMLFFKNVTFYWGGIRETGIMYLSFLPFFIAGSFVLLKKRVFMPFIAVFFIFLLVSLSPEFPESRFVFFSLPFLSFIAASGLYQFLGLKNKFYFTFVLLLSAYMLFEFAYLLHFYTVHYPLQVSGFSQKITGFF